MWYARKDFWLASHPKLAGSWSQAGAMARHGLAGYWWATIPEEEWPQDQQNREIIESNWDESTGDARQEIVLIGMEMDESNLIDKFNNCLLNDEEMAQGPVTWQLMDNPFKEWTDLIA